MACAGGHYLQSILKRLPSTAIVSYIGLDIDQNMVLAARDAWEQRKNEFPCATAQFVQSNAEKIDELGLKADIVFCSNAFMYIARPQRAIKAMLKTARKHCVIRSYFWNQTFIVKRAWEERLNETGEPDTYDLWNIYSEKLFERMVSEADPQYTVQWKEDNNGLRPSFDGERGAGRRGQTRPHADMERPRGRLSLLPAVEIRGRFSLIFSASAALADTLYHLGNGSIS